MIKSLLLLSLTLLSVTVISDSASSMGIHTLTVTPSVTDIVIDPGATTTKRVTIANQGDKDFSLQLKVAPYSVTNEQYDASFEPVEGRTLVNEWVQIATPVKAEVKSSKYLDADLNITVPANTPPGGYSAVLLVESSIAQESATGVTAKNRIAHILYINVNGPVERAGNVKTSSLPFLAFSGEQTLSHTINNLGGTNEKATVDVLVKDAFGRDVSGQLVERYVLPGTKRTIETTWDGSVLFGVYNVTISSEIAGKEFRQSPQWMVVIHPLFLFVGVVTTVASVWLRPGRFVSMKKRRKKS